MCGSTFGLGLLAGARLALALGVGYCACVRRRRSGRLLGTAWRLTARRGCCGVGVGSRARSACGRWPCRRPGEREFRRLGASGGAFSFGVVLDRLMSRARSRPTGVPGGRGDVDVVFKLGVLLWVVGAILMGVEAARGCGTRVCESGRSLSFCFVAGHGLGIWGVAGGDVAAGVHLRRDSAGTVSRRRRDGVVLPSRRCRDAVATVSCCRRDRGRSVRGRARRRRDRVRPDDSSGSPARRCRLPPGTASCCGRCDVVLGSRPGALIGCGVLGRWGARKGTYVAPSCCWATLVVRRFPGRRAVRACAGADPCQGRGGLGSLGRPDDPRGRELVGGAMCEP